MNIDKDSSLFKILLIVFLLALSFFLFSIGYYLYAGQKQGKIPEPVQGEATVFEIENLPTVPSAEKEYNVLLLGHGDPGHPGGDLADSLIVLHFNTLEKKAVLISVPRDTWLSVQISEGKIEKHKINEIFLVGKEAFGQKFGFKLIKQAVGEVIGLPIHHFVFINFAKFMEAVDALEGIEVDVPVTFDEYFYPIRGKELETCGKTPEEVAELTATLSGFELEKQFECRYDQLHFDQGMTEMNGETALKFVRSRHSDQHGGDFARAERQQAVLIGIKDKLLSLDGLKKADDFFEKLEGMVETDLDVVIVEAVAELVVGAKDYTIDQVVLSTENVFNASKNTRGQFILVPKAGEDRWGNIHQLISEQI